MSQVEDEQAQAGAKSGGASTFFAFVVIVSVIGLGALIAYRIYPNHVTRRASPSFIDNIFANDIVIFSTRLVLLSLAAMLAVGMVFIVISIYKRGKAGHWITKFGPFETKAIEDLEGVAAYWEQAWQSAQEEVQSLTERLEASSALIDELSSLLDGDGSATKEGS